MCLYGCLDPSSLKGDTDSYRCAQGTRIRKIFIVLEILYTIIAKEALLKIVYNNSDTNVYQGSKIMICKSIPVVRGITTQT